MPASFKIKALQEPLRGSRMAVCVEQATVRGGLTREQLRGIRGSARRRLHQAHRAACSHHMSGVQFARAWFSPQLLT